MKYLQSDNSKNTYGLYRDEIGPGHLVAIIEFEPSVDGDKLIRSIAAADALLALLTEGIGIHDSDDLAADLEIMSNWMVSPEFADKLRAKAQAIRAAIAEAKGEPPRGSTSPGTPKRRAKR